MARFIGNINTRLGAVSSGFSSAKVFTDPGTTSFQIPSSATKAKVYVIGAGSNYRTGRYCATSSGCWSGVDYPTCNYSFDFCGHLMGAGGGYAEKFYTGIGGTNLTINVGSPTVTANAYYLSGNSSITGFDGNFANTFAVGSTVIANTVPAGTTVVSLNVYDLNVLANSTSNLQVLSVATGINAGAIGAPIFGPGVSDGTYISNVSGTNVSLSRALNTYASASAIYNGTYSIKYVSAVLSNTANASGIVSTTFPGLSSSSVSGSGIPSVTATNATEVPLAYTCTSAVTARDGSFDVRTSVGFKLPVCGYQICYNAFNNIPGCGVGGDFNAIGGAGVLVPEFVSETNTFDATIQAATGSSVACAGWSTPYITCHVVTSYHTVYGSVCCYNQFPQCYPCNCTCPFVCNDMINYASPSTSLANYIFLGSTNSKRDQMAITTFGNNNPKNNFSQDKPIGVGASAGTNAGTGRKASSPDTTMNTNWGVCGNATTMPSAGGGGILGNPSGTFATQTYGGQGGYDYVFGGTNYTCYCLCMNMGCVYGTVACGGTLLGNSQATSYCCKLGCNGFQNVFGSLSYSCWFCFPYSPSGGSGTTTINKCLAFTYEPEKINGTTLRTANIDTALVTDENGVSLKKFEYGQGAASSPATVGGGGNRWYPAGGAGAVVVMWG
jgi:hypothetical protein